MKYYQKRNFKQIAKSRSLLCVAGVLMIALALTACNKLVKIPEPINSITSSETYGAVTTANSAIDGIYLNMSNGGYVNGGLSPQFGELADELNAFGLSPDEFATNDIPPDDETVSSTYWSAPYFNIYQANAAIEGLAASTTIPVATKIQLTAQAKFVRAISYFYLVNFFGDVPLVTSTSYANNSLLPRTPAIQLYQEMISDLTAAQSVLPTDYSASSGERIRPNRWAATALLARVYLYYENLTGNASYYIKADSASSAVIANTNLFSLVQDLNGVFLKNSSEAIWQLQPVSPNTSYATGDGYNFIPYPGGTPNYTLTDQLIASFEPNDKRLINWADTLSVSGTVYYYPYKYKVLQTISDNITEYIMVLRLAEQYLIRAEAEANGAGGGLAAAIADLNVIRARAGLANLPATLNATQVMAAVMQERKIEFFAEQGNRWFDLKRTGKAVQVLSADKGFSIKTSQLLFPIPQQEIQTDPNLKQNPGY